MRKSYVIIAPKCSTEYHDLLKYQGKCFSSIDEVKSELECEEFPCNLITLETYEKNKSRISDNDVYIINIEVYQ